MLGRCNNHTSNWIAGVYYEDSVQDSMQDICRIQVSIFHISANAEP